ncbi:hypothetical protein ACFOLF_05995 [Paenibacillus sepulcri]|uniref:Uncharacterized protein n=1 Tax=Paenibacillus sepulcri TaxID=359917 RepID=A0ABS7C844_9BACL|nr:hypothetical protein [Paenibacillus sepulcri]
MPFTESRNRWKPARRILQKMVRENLLSNRQLKVSCGKGAAHRQRYRPQDACPRMDGANEAFPGLLRGKEFGWYRVSDKLSSHRG